MASLARLRVVWLLVMLLPFQPLTGAVLDIFGPAHVHLGLHGHADHGNADHADDDYDDHGHDHHHAPFDRHRHAAADATVITLDDGHHEDGPTGWSGTLCVVLPCVPPRVPAVALVRVHETPADDRISSRFLDPLERPPRARFG
jgi:hypothetical protein